MYVLVLAVGGVQDLHQSQSVEINLSIFGFASFACSVTPID